MRRWTADTSLFLATAIEEGRRILFEGAQATMLDIDHGTYPYVTSSNASIGGVCTGLGVSPRAIGGVLGVAKAYTTRVGEGPLPTELFGEMAERLRESGQEYGASTGRPRRCGWFDAVVVRYAARINGLDALALTKLDVLDGLDELKICTGYRVGGRIVTEFPADLAAGTYEAVYEITPRMEGTDARRPRLRRAANRSTSLHRPLGRGQRRPRRDRLDRIRSRRDHHSPPVNRGDLASSVITVACVVRGSLGARQDRPWSAKYPPGSVVTLPPASRTSPTRSNPGTAGCRDRLRTRRGRVDWV